MPQGSKAKYTAGQEKKAEHIEQGYEKKGVPPKKAKAIAWATVNKQTGGGEKSGSGKSKPESEKSSARKESSKNAAMTKHKQSSPSSLESETKQSLLEKAREKNIPRRSTMNKAELILALRRPDKS